MSNSYFCFCIHPANICKPCVNIYTSQRLIFLAELSPSTTILPCSLYSHFPGHVWGRQIWHHRWRLRHLFLPHQPTIWFGHCGCWSDNGYGDFVLGMCSGDSFLNVTDLVRCIAILSVVSRTLQWRHNKRDSVSNHQPHDCFLNRLFRHRSNKTSKLRVTGLCTGKSPEASEFPAQMASS